MNLPSTEVRLHVAKLSEGNGFVVQWDISYGAGSIPEHGRFTCVPERNWRHGLPTWR